MLGLEFYNIELDLQVSKYIDRFLREMITYNESRKNWDETVKCSRERDVSNEEPDNSASRTVRNAERDGVF